MAKQTDQEDFQNWLQNQIKEANLTPAELADFQKWLMSRKCEHDDGEHHKANITVKDVVELVAWAKSRMSDAFLKHDERREFSNWLAHRVKATTCLSDDEIRTIIENP